MKKFEINVVSIKDYITALKGTFNLTPKDCLFLEVLMKYPNETINKDIRLKISEELGIDDNQVSNRLTTLRKKNVILIDTLHPIFKEGTKKVTIIYEEGNSTESS